MAWRTPNAFRIAIGKYFVQSPYIFSPKQSCWCEVPDILGFVLIKNSYFKPHHRSPKAAAIGADSAVAGGPLFVPSKWESIDPSKAAEEAVTSNRWELFVDDQQNTAAVAGNNDVVPLGMNADDDEDVDGK